MQFIYLSVYLDIYKSIFYYLFIYLSIYQSIYLSQVLDDLLEEDLPLPGESGRGNLHPGNPGWAYLPDSPGFIFIFFFFKSFFLHILLFIYFW